jgi:hypothetical protein
VTHTVEILRSAQAQLAKIAKQDRDRITTAIRALANSPRPQGCKNWWDARLGEFGSEPIASFMKSSTIVLSSL